MTHRSVIQQSAIIELALCRSITPHRALPLSCHLPLLLSTRFCHKSVCHSFCIPVVFSTHVSFQDNNDTNTTTDSVPPLQLPLKRPRLTSSPVSFSQPLVLSQVHNQLLYHSLCFIVCKGQSIRAVHAAN